MNSSIHLESAVFVSHGAGGERARCFERPVETLTARRLDEVRPLLCRLDEGTRNGYWGVLALAYEAAPAFEPRMAVHESGDAPLALAALFDESRERDPPRTPADAVLRLDWTPGIDRKAYAAAVRRIHEYIAAGDTYQVNYTFPLTSSYDGPVDDLFYGLCRAQGEAYHALLSAGGLRILSFSPELFFEREGDTVRARPMKGTARRGRYTEEDRARRDALRQSEKEQAENLMIVDLLRNDLGRVAVAGGVRVDELFRIERYRTVWQMVSDIRAHVPQEISLEALFTALFPCGSVTGAPKIRTLEIIRELEPHARGFYTGAIGWIAPGGNCRFSVPIRTVQWNADNGLCLPVGSGITIDSKAGCEYEECLLKAQFAANRDHDFELLEALRLEDGVYTHFDRHLRRLADSAEFFDFTYTEPEVRQALEAVRQAHLAGVYKVRLRSDRTGGVTASCEPLVHDENKAWRVTLHDRPVDSADVFLYHKTSRRDVYEQAQAAHPECDDVLLCNERGELTESTRANIVLQFGDQLYTPPVESGLLRGTCREALLEEGRIEERILICADLQKCDSVILINSARGFVGTELVASQ